MLNSSNHISLIGFQNAQAGIQMGIGIGISRILEVKVAFQEVLSLAFRRRISNVLEI